MPQFIYYIPGADASDLVERAGLGYALDPECLRRCAPSRGPDQGRGVLLAHAEGSPPALAYAPETQEWERAPGGAYWVGYDRGRAPGPADLARPEASGVYTARLADGNDWTIPTARLYPEGTLLPQTRKYAEGGRVVRDVKPQYRELYLAADEVWQALESGAHIPEGRAQEIIEMALRANYRVSHAEINLLGLVDDRNWAVILHLLVSYPAWPGSPYGDGHGQE